MRSATHDLAASLVPAFNHYFKSSSDLFLVVRSLYLALSLLQDQSASSRLRGVTYSYQMTQPDRDVAQALLHAVSHDTNVNVRLSAVDALAKFAGDPEVRKALADSLAVQDSPLVQVALIDLLVQLHAREGVPVILKLSQDKDANEAVRQRAVSALEKLGGVQ